MVITICNKGNSNDNVNGDNSSRGRDDGSDSGSKYSCNGFNVMMVMMVVMLMVMMVMVIVVVVMVIDVLVVVVVVVVDVIAKAHLSLVIPRKLMTETMDSRKAFRVLSPQRHLAKKVRKDRRSPPREISREDLERALSSSSIRVQTNARALTPTRSF
ncbi:hypothetical protein M0802_003796 [Mischocyttarus mexicanus]|nr:hypothetical protein M0802_003796 [Mischocyttarus mexicanus]